MRIPPALQKLGLAAGILVVGAFAYWYYAPRCVSGNCENGFGTKAQNGVFRYTGSFQNGRAHGQGTFESLQSEHRYEGQWQNGHMHGNGRYEYPDGIVYSGEWKHNQRTGTGRLFHMPTDAEYYNGLWENDSPLETSHSTIPENVRRAAMIE
ncbi:MAG: hypothetical protein KDK34_01145 [Leptospiraceae bacterium]|nr:hypothetical protein [Leptospiraceae bacterium]